MAEPIDWCSDPSADNDEEAPGLFNEDFESDVYSGDSSETDNE